MKRRVTQCIIGLFLVGCTLNSCKKDGKSAPEPTPAVPDACPSVEAQGNLTISESEGKYTYTTSGGGIIEMDLVSIRIMHNDYPGFKIELWGGLEVDGVPKLSANHENLNGKHIKDRLGARRTIIFPDGAKITMVAEGLYLQLLSVSIYDGAESHRINPVCGKLIHSSLDISVAEQMDNAEEDGEAGGFEFTSTGLLFFNQYQEDAAGVKVENRYNLGEIFRDLPNAVQDHYDDPRLGHT